MTNGWNALLDELRALGGTAENLSLRVGPFGRGLFATDPAKPVELRIPKSVLVDVDDVVFEEGVFRVGPGSKLGSRERAFVETYEAEFSWGAGGRAETEAFFESALAIPEPARAILSGDLGMGFLFREITPEAVQSRFLKVRQINHLGRNVVMPIMDLANYGQLASYDMQDGVAVKGRFSDEILIRYAVGDPYGIFLGWGFASDGQQAFSVGMNARTRFGNFVIATDYEQCKSEKTPWIPKLAVAGDEFRFSFLMLGNQRFPRLPKGIFCRVMKDAGYSDVEEAFEYIRHANLMAFLRAIAVLDGVEGTMAETIRNVALGQLLNLSYCFGIRDPYDAAVPGAARPGR